MKSSEDLLWRDANKGLERGDFSRLAPLFDPLPSPGGDKCRIIEWYGPLSMNPVRTTFQSSRR
jgi:hypothetical protein